MHLVRIHYVIVLLFFPLLFLAAQPKMEKRALKRIDQLEKVKLLEILDMNEETSVKFFVRRKEFKQRQRQMQDAVDSLHENLHRQLEAGGKTDYKTLINEIIQKEDELMKSRMEYIRSQEDILNDEQIAKLIIFEREFRKELQDLLFKRGGKRARPDF